MSWQSWLPSCHRCVLRSVHADVQTCSAWQCHKPVLFTSQTCQPRTQQSSCFNPHTSTSTQQHMPAMYQAHDSTCLLLTHCVPRGPCHPCCEQIDPIQQGAWFGVTTLGAPGTEEAFTDHSATTFLKGTSVSRIVDAGAVSHIAKCGLLEPDAKTSNTYHMTQCVFGSECLEGSVMR